MRCHFPNKLYLLIYTVSLLLDLLFPSYSNICMCLHVHKYLIIFFFECGFEACALLLAFEAKLTLCVCAKKFLTYLCTQ